MRAMEISSSSPSRSSHQSAPCEKRSSEGGDGIGIRSLVVREGDYGNKAWIRPRTRKPTFLRRRFHGPSISNPLTLLLVAVLLLARTSHAAFISTFNNCLSPNTINSSPKQLQFTPYWVWAFFNSSGTSHNLNVTIYGNVAGIATQQPYPGPNDPQWNNPDDTVGKIVNVSKATNIATTLEAQFNVLDYTPYNAPLAAFCNTIVQGQCPIAPNFATNAYVHPLKSLLLVPRYSC